MPNNTALTGDRRQALGEALSDYFGKLDSDEGIRSPDGRILRAFDYCDSRTIDDLIDRAIVPALAASPVEQSAAAPIEELCDQAGALGFALVPLRPNAEMQDVMLEEDWQWEDLLAAAGTITTEQYDHAAESAPAPADERADALYDSAYCAGLQAGFRFGDAGDNNGLRKALESRAGYIEVLRSARASSANETGAEGARLKQRVIIGATVFEKGVETKYVLEALAR